MIPDTVRRLKARDGRFVILYKETDEKVGMIKTRTDCAHVARKYGEDGHPVWKLSGASHIAPFQLY